MKKIQIHIGHFIMSRSWGVKGKCKWRLNFFESIKNASTTYSSKSVGILKEILRQVSSLYPASWSVCRTTRCRLVFLGSLEDQRFGCSAWCFSFLEEFQTELVSSEYFGKIVCTWPSLPRGVHRHRMHSEKWRCMAWVGSFEAVHPFSVLFWSFLKKVHQLIS